MSCHISVCWFVFKYSVKESLGFMIWLSLSLFAWTCSVVFGSLTKIVGTLSYDEDTNQIPSKCKSEGMQRELACCMRYAFDRFIVNCNLGLKQSWRRVTSDCIVFVRCRKTAKCTNSGFLLVLSFNNDCVITERCTVCLPNSTDQLWLFKVEPVYLDLSKVMFIILSFTLLYFITYLNTAYLWFINALLKLYCFFSVLVSDMGASKRNEFSLELSKLALAINHSWRYDKVIYSVKHNTHTYMQSLIHVLMAACVCCVWLNKLLCHIV